MSGPGKKKPPLVAERRYPKASTKKTTKPVGKKTAEKKTTARKTTHRKTTRRRKKNSGNFITRFLRWIWRLVWWVIWRFSLVAGAIVALWVGFVYLTLPSLNQVIDQRAQGSVTLLDRYGEVFAWRGEQFGGMITAETVSPHLKNAVVATEDKRFYRHFGVSPRGVLSAIRINLREGRGPLSGHGGSTITQQTAKLLCLGNPYDPADWKSEAAYEADCRKGSLWRKAKEGIYALALEAKFSKDEILTIYLNRAFLGAGARGFEAASQRYFGTSANAVSPSEAAMLAGLLVAPTRYAPTNNLERSQERAATVLRLMEEQDYLTRAETTYAQANPAELSRAAAARAGGYFADWVMGSGPDFLTRETTEDVILQTTLDQRIQTAAEDAMQYIFENKVREGSEAQAAIVVMSADGAVRAMVGGRETKVTGAFNRAAQALRQTGSAFKPFVYAAALDLGFTYNSVLEDEPFCMNIPGSGEWCPKNYSRDYRGLVSMTQALQHSLNVPAVKVANEVGLESVRTVAEGFGISSDLALGPALALGASEATLIEMTGAYAGILNGGSAVTPYGLVELRLQGEDLPLMKQEGGIGERVISENAARQLTYMMNRVIEAGTGTRARLPGWQAAGKTGTTNSARDAWFIGFTADYVVGVWMGYDDNTPLSGVTGGGLPADIWREATSRVIDGLQSRPLPMITPAPEDNFISERPRGRERGNRRDNRRRNSSDSAIEDLILDLFGIRRRN